MELRANYSERLDCPRAWTDFGSAIQPFVFPKVIFLTKALQAWGHRRKLDRELANLPNYLREDIGLKTINHKN